MKSNLEIIIFASLVAFLAIRIYKKYIRKDSGPSIKGKQEGTPYTSTKKDDDYEPYSKK